MDTRQFNHTQFRETIGIIIVLNTHTWCHSAVLLHRTIMRAVQYLQIKLHEMCNIISYLEQIAEGKLHQMNWNHLTFLEHNINICTKHKHPF
jgi:hypothetical protein